MEGGLLEFVQVWLHLNEVGLEVHIGFVVLCLGPPGVTGLLELSHLRDKAVCDLNNLAFHDRLTHRSGVVDALVEPFVEALEWLFGILGFPESCIIRREVCSQYTCLVDL